MQIVNLDIAKENLAYYQNNVLQSNDEVKIVSEFGNTVLISEKEWNQYHELMLILKDKVSMNALIESHQNRDNNIENEGLSFEEVFGNI